MSYEQFQENWEKAAGAELSSYLGRSACDLLDEIANGKYGTYYQIWYALQGRTTFERPETYS